MQGLHRAQRTAHHRRKARDAQVVGEARLRVHPVFDRDHREIRAERQACRGIGRLRAGRAKTATQVIHADHEEAIRIERLARANHVVPPAQITIGVKARNVVRGVERVAHEDGVRARRVERAVGLVA